MMRRMAVSERIRGFLIRTLGKWTYRFWMRSLRIRVQGEEGYRRLREEGRPVILIIWHGRIFIAPYFFRNRNIMPLVSRISTLMVAALAWLVATRFQSILEALGLASEILAEGFFIPGVAMLFMRRPFPTAGLLSVSLGGGYAVLAFLGGTGLLSLPLPQWPYSVPLGLALSLGGFLGGLAWDRRKSRAVFTPAGE